MNKLETILTTFVYIFIIYSYINVNFRFKSDKWTSNLKKIRVLIKHLFTDYENI